MRTVESASTSERTKTFSSPETPSGDADVPELPDWAVELFSRALAPSGYGFQIRPDQEATLVAAMHAYMVGLEDFANLRGLVGPLVKEREWLPYRVHLNVVADPGWWTRYYGFDAVVDIHLGGKKEEPRSPEDDRDEEEDTTDQPADCPPDMPIPASGIAQVGMFPIIAVAPASALTTPSDYFRVVSATPSEAGQALQEMQSTFRSLAGLLGAEGAFSEVALDAEVSALRAAAQKLEGLRTNTTMIVSYPASNCVRVRFRPEILPNIAGRDLQPNARLLTLTVLVHRTLAAAKPALKIRNGDEVTQTLDAPADVVNVEALVGQTVDTTTKARGDGLASVLVESRFEPSLGVEQAGFFQDGGELVVPCYFRQDPEQTSSSSREVEVLVPRFPPEQKQSVGPKPLVVTASGFHFTENGPPPKTRATLQYEIAGVQKGATLALKLAPGKFTVRGGGLSASIAGVSSSDVFVIEDLPTPSSTSSPIRLGLSVTETLGGAKRTVSTIVELDPFEIQGPGRWLEMEDGRLKVQDRGDVQIQIQSHPGAQQGQVQQGQVQQGQLQPGQPQQQGQLQPAQPQQLGQPQQPGQPQRSP